MSDPKDKMFPPHIYIDEMIQFFPDGAIKATISKRDECFEYISKCEMESIVAEKVRKAFQEAINACEREEQYDDYCKEKGGRLTSPIRELRSYFIVCRDNAAIRRGGKAGGVND